MNSYRNDGDHETSNWVPEFENSVLEELGNENGAYAHRKVGVKEAALWKNKKCPSCKLGFITRSDPIKCDGCDSYTHQKPTCLMHTVRHAHFYCKTCNPVAASVSAIPVEKPIHPSISKVDTGFKCNVCGLVTSTKYSMKRHLDRKHNSLEIEARNINVEENAVNNENDEVSGHEEEMENNSAKKGKTALEIILDNAGLMNYIDLFTKEDIDAEMLTDLNTDEFMNMTKELGIATWGQRRNLTKALEEFKNDSKINEPERTFIPNITVNEESRLYMYLKSLKKQ